MKMNGISPFRKTICCFVFCLFLLRVSALPDYSFRNPILESGNSLSVGAVYLFRNVKTGVDARVTIVSFTGGISLHSIDETWTGFHEAFQPFINVPSRANGYVEFEIKFYDAGTRNLKVQSEIPMTPIDVDGAEYTNGMIYEKDQIKLSGGYYDFSTSTNEISVTNSAGWVSGKNISGWSYDGVDTTAKEVMFTVVNSNANMVTIRIGAENNSDDFDVRYRSVYFKKFYYPNGLLASSPLLNFNGSIVNNNVELRYVLSEPEKIKTVLIEKSFTDMKFHTAQNIPVTGATASYSVRDAFLSGTSYYRLKMIYHSGEIRYSNVLKFENTSMVKETYRVFPSSVNDRVTVMLHTASAGTAELRVIDYNGKVVYVKLISMAKGVNNTTIDGLDNLSRGNYAVVILNNGNLYSQKIIKH